MQQPSETPVNTPYAPPPWKLTGRGWVLLYRFDADFVQQVGQVAPYADGDFKGGVGAVMLLDYHTSPVGPYQELLFIPGVFGHGRGRYHTVTTIYVSTQVSVENGRDNWGVPKQLASFNITQHDERTTQFTAAQDDNIFFDATLESGLVRFPVNTAFVPKPMSPKLLQQHPDGHLLVTAPYAAGVIGPVGTLKSIAADGVAFPDVSSQTPIGIVEWVSLRLTFPSPRTVA